LSSTFFVFPPNGDNVGKGRGSVYSIKAIPSGKYLFIKYYLGSQISLSLFSFVSSKIISL